MDKYETLKQSLFNYAMDSKSIDEIKEGLRTIIAEIEILLEMFKE